MAGSELLEERVCLAQDPLAAGIEPCRMVALHGMERRDDFRIRRIVKAGVVVGVANQGRETTSFLKRCAPVMRAKTRAGSGRSFRSRRAESSRISGLSSIGLGKDFVTVRTGSGSSPRKADLERQPFRRFLRNALSEIDLQVPVMEMPAHLAR